MRNLYRCTVATAAIIIGCALSSCAATPGRKEALDPVFAVAFSADGRTLAASSMSEEVALFDVAPLRFRALLTSQGVKAKRQLLDTPNIFRSPPIAFSPDGNLLVAAGLAGDLAGWDIPSGVVRFRRAMEGHATQIAFFPNGRWFLSVGTTLQRRSVETGAVIDELKAPEGTTISAAAVSPDGKVVLAGLSTGEIAEYDAASSKVLRVMKGHAVAVTAVAVSPDGSGFASTAGRFDLRLWNAKDAAPVPNRLSDMGGVGDSLEKSVQEGSVLMLFTWLLGTARGFQVVGAPTMGPLPSGGGPDIKQAAKETSSMCSLTIAYSPDGRFLATTAHLSMLRGELHLVLADLVQKTARAIHGIYGCSVAFTADSKFAITGGLGAPQIWNAETGARVD